MDDELIRVAGLATRVACERMTPRYLRALSDSIEQVCCLPAMFAWDRKATAYAEIVNLLADAAADPVLALLLRNVPGRLYDLMVTVGPAADDVIAGSRRRLLALIRARGADGAGQEMEQHVEGLSWMAERGCVSVLEATLWTANKIPMVDLDYVTVGAGAVGCPPANRLPADPDNQALLLGCYVRGAMVEG
jgi:FCD domain-containing protein